MRETLSLLFAFIIIFMSGMLLCEIPFLRIKDPRMGIKAPIYFMLGTLALSLYMYFLFLLKIRYTLTAISMPFLLYFIYYSFKNFRLFPKLTNDTLSYLFLLCAEIKKKDNILFAAALLSLILALTIVFYENLICPVFIGDVRTVWFFKAKLIYFSKTIPFDLFTNPIYWFTSPTYPLLTSLNIAWIALCLGHWSDTVTKTFYSVLYLAMIIFFYTSLKRLIKSKMAMIGTFITFTIPHVIGDITTGYVDLNVAFFGCVAMILLFEWMNDRKKREYFYLSALFVGAAAWTHNEGLMLFAAMILTILTYFIRQLLAKKAIYSEIITNLMVYCVIYLAITAPFKALITFFGLKQLWVSNFWQLFSVIPNLWRMPTILSYLLYELFLNTYLWMYFWIFFIIVLFINIRNILKTNLIYFLLFIFFSFAMVFEVFLVAEGGSTPEALVHTINQNLDRALLIIPISAGFLMFASFSKQAENSMDKRT
jgi:hypothetical protein